MSDAPEMCVERWSARRVSGTCNRRGNALQQRVVGAFDHAAAASWSDPIPSVSNCMTVRCSEPFAGPVSRHLLLFVRMAVFEEVGDGYASPAFDGRFDDARDLIRSQRHRREEPLHEGGRWPVSVMIQPDPGSMLSMTLQRLMVEAIGFAGPHHWRTGRPGTAHLTVRALERRRNGVVPDDAAVQRYAGAMRRAAIGCGPLSFKVQGLTVTPGTVMAIATPTDGQADRLLGRFGRELRDDGWLEAAIGVRDIWYLNLLHFAGRINNPVGLLGWVDAHRQALIGTLTVRECRLIRWEYEIVDDRYDLFPVTLASALFAPS